MGSALDDSTLADVEEEELPSAVEISDLTPVEAVTRNLRGLFRGFDKFDDTYLVGEVGDFSPHADHLYFSITAASANATIKCVVWGSKRDDLDIEIEPDMLVAVRGELTFFEGGGYPSLEVEEAHLVGESAYWRRIKQLRDDLQSEGLLDPERKQSLPRFPEVVGVVTAAGSDAEQDLIESIHSRYPDVDILIADSTVQGTDAPEELGAAIEAVDASRADVIVVARGGGSDTALRTFNEEPVVRAVADAETPTVAAIGHDADEPLIDEVADERVKTPTAAGDTVVVDKAEFQDRLEQATQAIDHAYATQVSRWGQRHRQAIDSEYQRLSDQWLDVQATSISVAYTDVVETWVQELRTEVSSTYTAIATEWTDTSRRRIRQRSSRLIDRWLEEHQRAVRAAYREHARGWVDDQRTTIKQAVRRLEQEYSFEEEKAGLERRNKVLLAIVIVLVLLLVGMAAIAFGLV